MIAELKKLPIAAVVLTQVGPIMIKKFLAATIIAWMIFTPVAHELALATRPGHSRAILFRRREWVSDVGRYRWLLKFMPQVAEPWPEYAK
jgi:hypothetical protein